VARGDGWVNPLLARLGPRPAPASVPAPDADVVDVVEGQADVVPAEDQLVAAVDVEGPADVVPAEDELVAPGPASAVRDRGVTDVTVDVVDVVDVEDQVLVDVEEAQTQGQLAATGAVPVPAPGPVLEDGGHDRGQDGGGDGGRRSSGRAVARRSRVRAPLPARDRRHTSGRARTVSARFTQEEYEALAVAAAGAGLTPTGYVAEVALAAASGGPAPAASPEREALVELMQARVQLRRYGTNVNQAVAALHSTGEAPEWLERAVERTAQAVERLDRAAALLARRATR